MSDGDPRDRWGADETLLSRERVAGHRNGIRRRRHPLHARGRSPLRLFSRNRRFRVFRQKGVPEILAIVLGDLSLRDEYQQRNYTDQAGESDFEFASRLMEEEGIYYYFVHEESAHRLTIAPTSLGAPQPPSNASNAFDPTS
ncbi:hypothetical protein Pan216_21920 [Planctomycetes bacterium Pan216]|uniref:Phage-related baseplate assembly protein n=1 Tax=Kolteria novifilia TaxID=2527975 RepID=A0A518B2X9_9BACT|nr:hypothetical protein Pan216_21920 [Planctomycetes bacterium Pan216]